MAQQETAGSLAAAQEIGPRPRRPAELILRALLRRKLAVLGMIYIAIFYFCGIFAPLVAPYDPSAQNLESRNNWQGPSLAHPFGTDRNGRDMLSRIIYAARTTVVITLLTVVTGGLFIGPTLGLIAGYRRGFLDAIINRAGEVLSSMPDLLILILFTATFGRRLNNWIAGFYDLPVIGSTLRGGFASIAVLFFILTLIGWVGSMRFIRAQTLQLRESEYVLAARAMGAGTWRIVSRHILPNLGHLLILGMATGFGAVALSEIGLSFLGLGVRPPTPSFGEMISNGAGPQTLQRHPHTLLFPSFFAVMLLLSFSLLGDALNDVLNPKTREA
jgi:ABC-type dipeptide/oligopeptide/nickel transport system permease subunit